MRCPSLQNVQVPVAYDGGTLLTLPCHVGWLEHSILTFKQKIEAVCMCTLAQLIQKLCTCRFAKLLYHTMEHGSWQRVRMAQSIAGI